MNAQSSKPDKQNDKETIHLVWLKRDLRFFDHWPLWEASKRGCVVVLYVFEPDFWKAPENHRSHFDFIVESLRELDTKLQSIESRLAIRIGEFPQVLQRLSEENQIASILSHEETGNGFTFDRDKRVANWCHDNGIDWDEFPQTGVVRRLRSRSGWATRWADRMRSPEAPIVTRLVSPKRFDWGFIPDASQLGLSNHEKKSLQLGGESHAERTLESFLFDRGVTYQREMSSPITAETRCSRLSPYIAWGCISIKHVYQMLAARRQEIANEPSNVSDSDLGSWKRSLSSFASRLSWHCHFMQKLEDEPEIEFRNVNRVFDGLREDEFDSAKYEAWKAGRTGFPMVDACMRSLLATSWINFRMRAMLMSFASYHLWLHWRPTAIFMAQHFLDFEPGIHYSQSQMQSGVTGINTVRIYSPIKQAIDQDPSGLFIRTWLPELVNVPNAFIHQPELMSIDDQKRYGCQIGRDYSASIVNHTRAVKFARDRIYAIRKTDAAVESAKQVYQKHGSRKRRDPLPQSTRNRPGKLRGKISQPIATEDSRRNELEQKLLPGFEE